MDFAMIIYFEKSGTGIRIAPRPSSSTTDLENIIYASSVTVTTSYRLETPMLLEPEYDRTLDKEYDFIGHFISVSGKIKMSWNAWINKYTYWEPPILNAFGGISSATLKPIRLESSYG
jgi:hypothetical protein